MTYKLSAGSFRPQTLTITVAPSEREAGKVYIRVETDHLSGFTSFRFTETWNSLNLKEQHDWDDQMGEWSDDIAYLGDYEHVKTEKVQSFLKELAESFYEFHRSQDEAAQFTIRIIRELRVEDLVPDFGWEVIKTTSRRGSRRG